VSDNSVVSKNAEPVRDGGEGMLLQRVGLQPARRIAVFVAIALLAAGCGGDKSEVAAGQTLSEEALKQKCADAQWREKNLGVWYAVCRQPVGW
jgi:hypothetical protein